MLEEAESVKVLIESKIDSKIKILGIITNLKGNSNSLDYEIKAMADLANTIYDKFTKE